MKAEYKHEPVMTAVSAASMTPGGRLGTTLSALVDQWLLPAPLSNPVMLEMFRDRDRKPLRNLVPWAGEFAGKYLTHAVQILALTRDERLQRHLAWFVRELLSLQASDGYLGPWPKAHRLTGTAPNCFPYTDLYRTAPPGSPITTWDAWGHYHVMLGLVLWHEYSGDADALRGALRMADLFCRTFLDTGKRLVSIGDDDKNLAPIHALCLLYSKTGRRRYLAMAHEIERDFEMPPAGDYIRTALAGVPFYGTPRPRWESLHAVQGVAELYFITGDDRYRRALENIWWSVVEHDRHNNGGFSSGEKASGSPYHLGPIETCCTVAWMALSVDMLRMTGASVVADELELSMLNSGFGMLSPSGRWVTYNTPMEGRRIASASDMTSFQARPGQPELNCCSVNGPRALSMVRDWAFMRDADGLALNFYGPCTVSGEIGNGRVTIRQETDYPRTGRIVLRVDPSRTAAFMLKLRIPQWSTRTRVRVNDRPIRRVEPGGYLAIDRTWRRGDTVTLDMDMRLHVWMGQEEVKGRASIYRGPVLLTFDPRLNEGVDPDRLPVLDVRALHSRLGTFTSWLAPEIVVDVRSATGKRLRLCDHAGAGLAGDPYRTWFRVRGARCTAFGPRQTLRTSRPGDESSASDEG